MIKLRFSSQKVFARISFTSSSKVHNSFLVAPKRKIEVEVDKMLQIDGQSIKFVDRKLWKRDSFDGKLNFEKKIFEPLTLTSESVESGRKKVRRKCPIEVEYPRKRRILKRPKRFKTYYSDRKPLSIPRFSFPRCLMGI